jgi:hypothetical protein
MSIADSLLNELRELEGDLSREFLLAKIAADYGEGFSRLMREEIERQAGKKREQP